MPSERSANESLMPESYLLVTQSRVLQCEMEHFTDLYVVLSQGPCQSSLYRSNFSIQYMPPWHYGTWKYVFNGIDIGDDANERMREHDTGQGKVQGVGS